MIRTARVQPERGAFPAFGSTYLRRRQAASLFSRADQTFVIKRKCGKPAAPRLLSRPRSSQSTQS
jgi:hypothetical protein